MQIHFIEQEGQKLFSFNRYDFKSSADGKFIDGGFDYIRTNTEVKYGNIEDLIGEIREQFYWTAIYNKDMTRRETPVRKLLKELDTDHIIAILIYFTKRLKEDILMEDSWIAIHLIFLNELKYRHEHNIL